MVIIAKDRVVEPLFAVVPVQNQWRWKSRIKHTERSVKHFIDSGATVILIEAGFNRRELVFADSGIDGLSSNCGILGGDSRFRHRYIGIHTKSEVWLKECLINLAVQMMTHQYPDWQQVCWLDSDVLFIRPNWVGECIHKLQHGMEHDIAFLQMFSHARDVGPNYEMMPEDYPHANGIGFVEAWKQGKIDSDVERLAKLGKVVREDLAGADLVIQRDTFNISTDIEQLKEDLNLYPYPPRVWPGLAWACTRKAWDSVGGLFDVAAWGGADYHMSHALIEKTEGMMRSDLHRNYKKMVMQWYHRCRTHVRRNVGVMSGSIIHNWHGRKESRGYNAKHGLLAKIGFDPLRHLKRDSNGLWMLHDDRSTAFVKLRDMMRKIAMERDEDSTYTGLSHFDQGH